MEQSTYVLLFLVQIFFQINYLFDLFSFIM